MKKLAPLHYHGVLTAKPVNPLRLSVFDLEDDDKPKERKCPYDIL